ncbi:hypothetical protein K443DRAFT_679157 [Laccaria amethystina LaAM-08-1]|uniref:Uncharacterized protein n=1 Tax=Laccaria amethystina LaAM-08-1 TaxID=1095629 RepID=A0A0C9XS36_9AGAR|nr:hypothetical protein K443DRAFT_679157 [Laccaria amethystina LaAM-08-1]
MAETAPLQKKVLSLLFRRQTRLTNREDSFAISNVFEVVHLPIRPHPPTHPNSHPH